MLDTIKTFFGRTPAPEDKPISEREALAAEYAALSSQLETIKARRRAVAERLEKLQQEA